jgi:5-(carboxyamino)imidazole ribonucleotide mutase
VSSSPIRVGVIMGSISDWSTLEHASDTLTELGIEHETKIISAHRMPVEMAEYARTANDRGLLCIIAAAGGAAHLPGMVAAHTTVPVLGVPIPSTALQGVDALLSIVQMPAGVPVATFAIGKHGAINAALFAAALLGAHDPALFEKVGDRRRDARAAAIASEVNLPYA